MTSIQLVLDVNAELSLAMNDERLSLASDVALEEQYCPHQLSIYATESVRDQYLTALPAIYLSSVIVVFFFCALVFLLYDCLVERYVSSVFFWNAVDMRRVRLTTCATIFGFFFFQTTTHGNAYRH